MTLKGRFLTKSLEETNEVSRKFVELLREGEQKARIIGLFGDLGSGKTTFTKGIAEVLGVEDTVTSPTFVIEKIYKLENQTFDSLIHIDAYRLNSGEELKKLGWEEISSNPKNLILIEWPERVQDILPKEMETIEFKFIDENTREINFI
jgi:tRNA threonylcarbamoyladenosine biosynthesis protein TsaE